MSSFEIKRAEAEKGFFRHAKGAPPVSFQMNVHLISYVYFIYYFAFPCQGIEIN